MSRGRPRLFDPTIPTHIEQRDIPKGAYWDPRSRTWYTRIKEGDRVKRVLLANAKARLSEVAVRLEEVRGVPRGTLGWLCDLFHESPTFHGLAEKTRIDYEAQRKILRAFKARAGVLDTLPLSALSPQFLQALVDKIGATHPSKANHLIRYVSRVFSWGIPRGHCDANPAKGIEKAKERKRRRLPAAHVHDAVLQVARAHFTDYLWVAIELAYLMRLRGIEVLTLTDANIEPEGVRTNRRKGSRDALVLWSPRLRAAVDAAQARRARIWTAKRIPTPLRADRRFLLVNAKGQPVTRGALNTLWQNLMHKAEALGAIRPGERFGSHDLKRRGITDTEGTRADKREASGHKAEEMMDVYDLSVPSVTTPKGV